MNSPPRGGDKRGEVNKNRVVIKPPGVFNKMAPRVGLEPTTTRLTAGCSTIELSRNVRLTLTMITQTHKSVNPYPQKNYFENLSKLDMNTRTGEK